MIYAFQWSFFMAMPPRKWTLLWWYRSCNWLPFWHKSWKDMSPVSDALDDFSRWKRPRRKRQGEWSSEWRCNIERRWIWWEREREVEESETYEASSFWFDWNEWRMNNKDSHLYIFIVFICREEEEEENSLRVGRQWFYVFPFSVVHSQLWTVSP